MPLYRACKKGTSMRRGCCWTKARRSTGRTRTAHTPLFIACRDGHVDAVRLLLDVRRGGRPGDESQIAVRRRCIHRLRKKATSTAHRQVDLGARATDVESHLLRRTTSSGGSCGERAEARAKEDGVRRCSSPAEPPDATAKMERLRTVRALQPAIAAAPGPRRRPVVR